jgi:D-alanyl-D-alanine carboxypeptidase/D-alanyl-D-alanine-endopeptidase (penicillin-binding protein 4)
MSRPLRGDTASARAPFCAALIALLLFPSFSAAGELPQKIAALLGPRDSLVCVAPDNQTVFAHRPDTPRTPASTFKVLTALAAVREPGLDFRFTTEVFADGPDGVVVKGGGDPLLVSEALRALARELAATGAHCSRLVLDDSAFEKPIVIPGAGKSLNPYDATVGALCVNFNTVAFKRDSKGRIVSAEPETPLIPFAERIIQAKNLPSGRVALTHENNQAALYAGHLLARFLEEEGAGPCGEIRMGKAAFGAEPLLRFESPYTLREVLRGLLEHSNNYTANQVLLTMGARAGGAPSTLEKGCRILDRLGKDLGLQTLVAEEGSGISRGDQISARDMAKVLREFFPHRDLLKAEGAIRFKTGHLDGVRTLAGYMPDRAGREHAFVIFINTPGKEARPVLMELGRALRARKD